MDLYTSYCICAGCIVIPAKIEYLAYFLQKLTLVILRTTSLHVFVFADQFCQFCDCKITTGLNVHVNYLLRVQLFSSTM